MTLSKNLMDIARMTRKMCYSIDKNTKTAKRMGWKLRCRNKDKPHDYYRELYSVLKEASFKLQSLETRYSQSMDEYRGEMSELVDDLICCILDGEPDMEIQENILRIAENNKDRIIPGGQIDLSIKQIKENLKPK